MREPTIVAHLLEENPLTVLPEPSIDNLDLASLPPRLDDEMLERVTAIARTPLPDPEPANPRHFNQCLRVMLAVLPKRSSDDVSGELFVAAYQKKLGHYCDDAISFLADKAMERCQWFPTIHECIEIIGDWRRNDEHTRRRANAQNIAGVERVQRERDNQDWRTKHNHFGITQAEVDGMSEQMKRIGLACHALMHDETGAIVPWKPAPGEERF